jgi:hypothetical protein
MTLLPALHLALAALAGFGCSSPSAPQCTLASTTLCDFSDVTVESGFTYQRAPDGAVLTFTWIPSAQTAGFCASGADGCYHYSFTSVVAAEGTYEVTDGNTLRFYANMGDGGNYGLGPLSQACPISTLELTCSDSGDPCTFAGSYEREP